MALHLSSLEVSSLAAGRFSDLHPLSGIAELRKDGREWDSPLMWHLGAVAGLAVLTWASDNGSRVLCLPK
jgi:hypothetical protein